MAKDPLPPLRIEPALFERLLASDDALKALSQLDAWWSSRLDWTAADQPSSGLSQPEFDAHLYLLYTGEVGNGGHAQFFENSGGMHSAAVLAGLDRMGLADLHAIFAEACAVLPGAVVARDHRERAAAIERLSEADQARWSALDRRLYQLSRAAERRALEYVRGHRAEILVGERAPTPSSTA